MYVKILYWIAREATLCNTYLHIDTVAVLELKENRIKVNNVLKSACREKSL